MSETRRLAAPWRLAANWRFKKERRACRRQRAGILGAGHCMIEWSTTAIRVCPLNVDLRH